MSSLIQLSARAIFQADLQREVEEADCPAGLVELLRPALGDDRAQSMLELLAARDGPAQPAALQELCALSAGRDASLADQALVENILEWKDAPDPQLAGALDAGPDLARAATACWIRWDGRSSMEPSLCSRLALEGQPPWLERILVRTLGIVGGEGSLPVLQPLLRSEIPFTARVAIGAIVAIGSPMGVGLLGKLLYDRRSRVHADVARAICLLDVTKGAGAITSLAADSDPAVRAEALRLVGELAPAGAAGILLWRLGREDDEGVIEVLAGQLMARPAVDVMAGIAHGAAQPDGPVSRKCRALLARIRTEADITDEALERARKGYKPPDAGPNFAWLQAQEGGRGRE